MAFDIYNCTSSSFPGGKYHEQMQIANGATGFSYEKIFGRLLEEPLTEVVVEDPYIRSHHQVSNCSFNIYFFYSQTVLLLLTIYSARSR